MRVGPGVSPPKLVHKIEPEYTQQARDAHVQGTAVFYIVVNDQGRAIDIEVISPVGFGLDDRARAAIEQWRFQPGKRDGKPVNIAAEIEVNFRFPSIWFDQSYEKQRTAYNVALRGLHSKDGAIDVRAVGQIQSLSRQGFTPALYMEALLLREGKISPPDPERVSALIKKAAEKNHGPAMYELGRMYLRGDGVERDAAKGEKLIADAAALGSVAAQLYQGNRYEMGDGVAADPERARRSYRLCAAAGEAACQLRLARLLLALPERSEHYYIQAIAWLSLAADKGFAQANGLLEKEQSSLTPEQKEWANKVKSQLVPGH